MAASYGFRVFAIMGSLIAGSLILMVLVLVVLVAINRKFQRIKSAERFKCIRNKGGGIVSQSTGTTCMRGFCCPTNASNTSIITLHHVFA
jgi:hypothetical protein